MPDRRSVLCGLAALPVIAVGSIVPAALASALPQTFDPAAYLADLRAAGVRTLVHRGNVFHYAAPDCGFGEGWCDAQLRWADAIDACPDWLDQIRAALPEVDEVPIEDERA